MTMTAVAVLHDHDTINPNTFPDNGNPRHSVVVPPVPTSAEFTPTSAAQLAESAAAAAGLRTEPVELIRLGTNAVFRLSGGVIARIARSSNEFETAVKEVTVARALHSVGVACTLPWPVNQPIKVDGHPVTFWVEVPGPLGEPTVADLGTALRQIHGASIDVPLAGLDPFGNTSDRIQEIPVSDTERNILRDAWEHACDRWSRLQFACDPTIVHGDAHLGNVIRGADGSVVLIDFDSVCTGPREWDLTPTGLYATSLGWISRGQYRSFVDAYGGFDVTATPAFPIMARMREIRMTAWLAMSDTRSERVAAEVGHRIACIADPSLPRHWTAR